MAEQTAVVDFDSIPLKRGAHATREDGCCAMELVAWMAGEPHTDHPNCVCPVIAQVMRSLNDVLGADDRQKLKPFLRRVIGTNDGRAIERGYVIADVLFREFYPAIFEKIELPEIAASLRALPPLRNEQVVNDSRPTIAAAIEAANRSPLARALALDLDLALDLALALARALALEGFIDRLIHVQFPEVA